MLFADMGVPSFPFDHSKTGINDKSAPEQG